MAAALHCPFGLRIKSAMTGEDVVGVVLFTLTFDSSPIKGEGILSVGLACSPSPLIPLPSRERGIWSIGLVLFTRVVPRCGFPRTRE